MSRVFVDMDGTLAKWQADMPYEAIFEEHYFDTLPPQKNVLDAVKQMVKDPDFDVYILSAVLSPSEAPTALWDKNTWLNEYLPEIDKEHRIFCQCGVPKEHYIEGGVFPDDILLDDYSKNLHEWPGTAVKLINDVNATRGSWQGERVGYKDSPENIVEKIKDVAKEPQEHLPETESITVIPADRTPASIFFTGTDEEFNKAEQIESDRINAWVDILNRKGFSALSFERENDLVVLSRSTRPGIEYQLTWFSKRDGMANMDERYGGVNGSHKLEELPGRLYRETRSTGARVRVLCEKESENSLEYRLNLAKHKAKTRQRNKSLEKSAERKEGAVKK